MKISAMATVFMLMQFAAKRTKTATIQFIISKLWIWLWDWHLVRKVNCWYFGKYRTETVRGLKRMQNSWLAMNVCLDICWTMKSFLTTAFVNISETSVEKRFCIRGKEAKKVGVFFCSCSHLKVTVLIFWSESAWSINDLSVVDNSEWPPLGEIQLKVATHNTAWLS